MEKHHSLIIFKRQILYVLIFFLKNKFQKLVLHTLKWQKKLIFKKLKILRFPTRVPPYL